MKNRILKITALLLAINFLTSILAPTLMYALTAGPTAPEYTSFEPIDTTDMVNLATGDFTYNIPLLEVPGPEGGYPLALSYHAGISPEEEGSWVGLGWSLNAGAINRIVNLHPDDIQNELIPIHDTWSGGETRIYSVGIGIGLEGSASIGVGVDFANDTYKGSGVGGSVNAGIGAKVGGSGSVGIGISAGLGPYGGGYVGIGLTAGVSGDGASASARIGLTASFGDGESQLAGTASGSISARAKYGNDKVNDASLLDADISTGGSKPSVSPAGVSASAISDNSNNITSNTYGFTIPIPIPYTPLSINLGYRETRYFVDSYDHEKQLGVLYAAMQSNDKKLSFDAYSLKSATSQNPFFDKEINSNGGSIPAYDSYNVVGQGISGAIQPYLFEGGTITRKVKWNNVEGIEFPDELAWYDYSYKAYDPSKKVSFRFINEFSNAMLLNTDNLSGDELDDYKVNDSHYSVGKDKLTYNHNDLEDFNPSTGALAGSKHVEWFTNAEITQAYSPGTNGNYPNRTLAKGFIPNITNRNTFFSDGIYGVNIDNNIGGFMVTNSSGVNYHYAQPVYNFEETQVLYANSSTQGNSSRRIEKPIPYAYSWLLTGITGPDYVDRGIIGQIDEADWGYWIKFEYGKWADQYIWRTPNDGAEKDNWSEWQSFNAGKKELYYLDAIITRTHTALFVKDIRQDAKGIKEKENGGFGIVHNAEQEVTHCSASALRLSKVLLFNNRTLAKQMEEVLSIQQNDSVGNPRVLVSTRDELKAYGQGEPDPVIPLENSTFTRRLHYWEKVLTKHDLENINTGKNIADAASRQIVFDHDYSLCQNTPNSKKINYTSYQEENSSQTGKLTLNRVHFLGYEGKKVVPHTSFSYYNPSGYVKDKKDIWGMFKSDSDPATVKEVYQRTTDASANHVHAWSLTGISTGIGANIQIEYESDKYKNVVVAPEYNLSVSSVALLNPDEPGKLRLNTISSEPLTNIEELNYLDKQIRVKYVIRNEQGRELNQMGQIGKTFGDKILIVKSVEANALIVEGQELYADFKNTEELIPATERAPEYTEYTNHYLQAMNLFFSRDPSIETPGGGLRVKSISLVADNIANKTNYTYSEGTTAYEPYELNVNLRDGARLDGNDELKTMVGSIYKDQYINITANTPYLPSPGVIYGQVIVQDEVIDLSTNQSTVIPGSNYSTYHFQTFNQNMMPRTEGTDNGISQDKQVKKVTLKDFRNFVGALKEITIRSTASNLVLSQNINHYLHDAISDYTNGYSTLMTNYNNQGRIEHLYYEKKNIHLVNHQHLQITKVEEYPIIPLGQTVFNGKTKITKESKTIGFDFYTGNPTITWYNDGMGYQYLTKAVPAYDIEEYSEMGLKIKHPFNKHMLTQNAKSITYLVSTTLVNPVKESDFTMLGVMTASVQSWLKNGTGIIYPVTVTPELRNYQSLGIWLKGSSYSWVGDENASLGVDGSYPYSSFSDFDFTSGINPQWQLQEQPTKYDVYSHLLETRDVNGKYNAVLMDPLCIQVTATAPLASRSEIAYSGGEFNDYYKFSEGAVLFGDGALSINNAHTGKYSLAVSGGNKKGYSFTFLPKQGRKYHSSVWIYQPGGVDASGNSADFKPRLIAVDKISGVVIASALPIESMKARGYYLLSLNIVPSDYSHEIEVYCLNANEDVGKPQYYDDFRVHPLNAGFISYVYDIEKGWLTHILDTDNLYSRFEYDHAGKLKAVYKELLRVNEKLVTTNQHNYGKE